MNHYTDMNADISHYPVLSIPPQSEYMNSTLDFVGGFLNQYDLEDELLTSISHVIKRVLKLIINAQKPTAFTHDLNIKLIPQDSFFSVLIYNKGIPIFPKENWEESMFSLDDHEAVEELKPMIHEFVFENRGREGQVLRLTLKTPKRSLHYHALPELPEFYKITDVKIRRLRLDEIPEVSRLFYSVYEYNYIKDYVYYPNKLKEMTLNDDLISLVAVLPNNRIVGHVGILRLYKDPNIYEAALGIVDPKVKIKGLFSHVFQEVMDIMKGLQMRFSVFDFVTNHDYSQREVAKYGIYETCINVGSQISKTQAKLEKLGIGEDSKEMSRYSILYSIKPRIEKPFGDRVILPANLGEVLEFILSPLGISWIPAPRFFPLSLEGGYESELQESQSSVLFDFYDPGFEPMKAILEEWKHLKKDGYKYASIDFPLNHPGVGQMYDFFSGFGFFLAGLVPYKNTTTLALRIQALAPTQVGFSSIKVHSAQARNLLDVIEKEYERNNVL